MTTFPASSDMASRLESGNSVLVALATLPVLLAGVGCSARVADDGS